MEMAEKKAATIDLTKKAGFSKPLKGDTAVQVNGVELFMSDMREKAIASATDHPDLAGIKVTKLDVYVKPEERKVYWVAHHNKGEVSGSADI